MNRRHLSVLLIVPSMLFLAGGCSNDTRPPGATIPSVATSTAPATTSTVVLVPPEAVSSRPRPPSPVPGEQPGPTGAPAPSQQDDCSHVLEGWTNLGPKGTGEAHAPENAEVVSVRVGQHACFDQITIEIATSAAIGSHVEYTANPAQDGSGFPPNPPITGGAVLQASVFAPSEHLKQSSQPYEYAPSYFAGWGALREVRYGVSFEGSTSFFIGVVSDNAFRMRSWDDNGTRKIIIQIAH